MWVRRILGYLVSLSVTEAAIFYPPFPPVGQYHETPSTSPTQHMAPEHGMMPPSHAYPSHNIAHNNAHNSLLSLIHYYLSQIRQPQYHRPRIVYLPNTPPPPPSPAVEMEGGPPHQEHQLVGGAALDGSMAQANPPPPQETEGGVTQAPPVPSPLGGLGGLFVGGRLGLPLPAPSPGLPLPAPSPGFPLPAPSLGLPLPAPSPGTAPQRPTVYNLQNNVPNNPLPIAQIRNRFYERLCYQTQPTVMPIIQAYYPNIMHPMFPADTADPPACSCIPFNDCESAAHRFINEKTKDECGSTLTGFACCCEEPPVIGR